MAKLSKEIIFSHCFTKNKLSNLSTHLESFLVTVTCVCYLNKSTTAWDPIDKRYSADIESISCEGCADAWPLIEFLGHSDEIMEAALLKAHEAFEEDRKSRWARLPDMGIALRNMKTLMKTA